MNLSLIGFRYARVVFAVMIVMMVAGVVSYFKLPANEDPAITIRQALIVTNNPGLPTDKVEMLITKPLELAIRKRPEVKNIRSTSAAGQSTIIVEVYDKYFELDQIWDDVRDEINKVRLPDGTYPPYMNDRFGDVAVMTVVMTADEGFTQNEKTTIAQDIRDRLYNVKDTQEVVLLGAQPERIYIEIENAKMAETGYTPNQLAKLIGAQNIIQSGGSLDIDGTTLTLQPTGSFNSVEDIQKLLIPLPNGNGMLALSDIANIHREPIDPAYQPIFFNGKNAIMFAINMDPAANILEYTPRLEAYIDTIQQQLPAGVTLDIATKQAVQVAGAVYGVTQNVIQTLIIVLIVVMLFLGLRTGLIVGSVVPAVMLISLTIMSFADMSLQRMSLATLMIALGLLVENGIVIAEDFRQRLERGETRDEALEHGGKSLAMPLLTSSLTTILVFLPLMLAVHVAGEYTRSISIVITIVLLTSWIVAMMVTPTLCYHFMQVQSAEQRKNKFSIFDPFRVYYSKALHLFLRHRVIFLIGILLSLVVAGQQMTTVPKKFFPDSDRTQILVYVTETPQTSMRETASMVQQASQQILNKKDFPHVNSVTSYAGFGGPRFVLSLTPVFPAPNKGFMVISVDEQKNMDKTIIATRKLLETKYPQVQSKVMRMFLGPSDANTLQVRVTGPDAEVLYKTAQKIEKVLEKQSDTINISNDWQGMVTELKVDVDEQRAKAAGITTYDIANSLKMYYSGTAVSVMRDGDESLPIILRAPKQERDNLTRLYSAQVYSSLNNLHVPLTQIANIIPVNTYANIQRKNLVRSIVIEARNLKKSSEEFKPIIDDEIQKIAHSLPLNHAITYDGAIRMSKEAQVALSSNFPLVLGVIIILLILQFNSYRRALIVMLAIPLMMVGAVFGFKVMGAEFGFMATLGLYALAGIIVNNAIVLIDRIDLALENKSESDDETELLIDASVRRLRPIIMSTVTTMLGLLPLLISRDPLFFPMATVIAFGLALGAIYTLAFTPIAYTLFFRVKHKK
ncbi:MAG: efflux RND transporter permease subunit [Gammaproteobacteria bacterium]|nr:efflux RND transporter permease subunit [Gammaproteobacteria bacterium]